MREPASMCGTEGRPALRILLIGVDATHRKLVRYALEGAGYLTIEADDAQSYCGAADAMPVVAIVRIALSEIPMDAFDIRLSGRPLVTLSDEGPEDSHRIPLHAAPAEIVMAVRRALDERKWLKTGPLALDPSARMLMCGRRVVSVSEREFDVVHLLMLNAGRHLTRAEIRRLVWGVKPCRLRAIDVAISRIRDALGEDGAAIETLRHIGYRLAPPQTVRAPSRTAPGRVFGDDRRDYA